MGVSGSVSGSDLGQSKPSGDGEGIQLADQGKTEVGKSMGYGADSGHDSSITRSGINTVNIHITDTEKQQQLTGKNAAETQAQVKTELTTDTYAQHAGYLQNNFDKDRVLNELNLQVEVTKELGLS